MRCPATLITLSVNPPVILKASIPILWSRKLRLQEVQWPAGRGSVLRSPQQLQPQHGGLGHTYPSMLLTTHRELGGPVPQGQPGPLQEELGGGGLVWWLQALHPGTVHPRAADSGTSKAQTGLR